jgi:predicted RNase H-like nuclease (RuvC/YqgF family)
MIDILSSDPVAYVLGGGASITALIYFIRHVRRLFYTEKRDTSIDQASQNLFENLRLENTRMAEHMNIMSDQLKRLAQENAELNVKIADLTISVRMLVALEKENIELQDKILIKDKELSIRDEHIESLTKTLKEALEAVRLRGVPASGIL